MTESQSSAPPSAPAAIPNVNGLSTSTETNVQSAAADITPTEIQIDEEFLNHIHFMQQAETYFTLKYAIKHGDVGLIERVIQRCCLFQWFKPF